MSAVPLNNAFWKGCKTNKSDHLWFSTGIEKCEILGHDQNLIVSNDITINLI